MKIIDGIKYYEQEDVDNITNKARETIKTKYEQTHVELPKFQELEKNFQELQLSNKKNEFKEVFKSNGGNLNTYNDFITLHSDIVDLKDKELTTKMNELKETKKHFFNGTSTPTNGITPPKDNDVFASLGGGEQEPLIAGTIYKQWKI